VAALRPYLHPAGDTVADAAAATSPGVPVAAPQAVLPRTDEIPLDQLRLVTDETPPAEGCPPTGGAWGTRWVNRLHWLIAALIAGVAMGVVLGRGWLIP
jgi:hypothetical protein